MRANISRLRITQHIRGNLSVEYGIVVAIGSNVAFGLDKFGSPAIQNCTLDHNQTAVSPIHLPQRSLVSANVNAPCAKHFAPRLVGKQLSCPIATHPINPTIAQNYKVYIFWWQTWFHILIYRYTYYIYIRLTDILSKFLFNEKAETWNWAPTRDIFFRM